MRKYILSAVATFLLFTANAQWLVQNAGFTNDTLGFYEMSLPDKNTAWAVCYDGKGGLLSGRPVLDFTRTTDGGATWVPGKTGTDETLRFSNISALNDQEAWVALHKIGPVPNNLFLSFGKGGGIFHTTDGGTTWEHVNPGELFDNNSVPRFVHFNDKNHGIAVGDPNGGYFEVYLTNNKGKKWKRVPQKDLPAPLLNEVAWISGHAVVGNTIWFGTSAGRMYKSIDFGKSWTVHTVDPLPGTYVNEIAFLDDGLTGVAHLRSTTRTFVYSTTDGGLTWTNYFQPANWKNSRVTAVPGTTAFVSTSINSPQFRGSAVSFDAGQTWTEIEKDASKAVCRFLDATTGYAGGFFLTGPPFRGGIYKSVIDFQALAPQENKIAARGISMNDVKIAGANEVKVFPTPANDMLIVTVPDDLVKGKSAVSIVSMGGNVMLTKTAEVKTKTVQLNVSSLPSGNYMLRIESEKQTVTKLIIISR